MDWSTRSPWNPPVPIRSGPSERQGSFGLRGLTSIKDTTGPIQDSRKDASTIRPVRKPHKLCAASVFRDARPTLPRDTSVAI
jgi:hypothetical protein